MVETGQEGAQAWSAGGRSGHAVTLSPSLVISDCWSPMDSIGVLKSDLTPMHRGKDLGISLRVNFAKGLGIFLHAFSSRTRRSTGPDAIGAGVPGPTGAGSPVSR